jgi:hypothetical protein
MHVFEPAPGVASTVGIVLGIVLGTAALVVLDDLLLRAERRGWINYRRRGLSRGGAAFHSLTLQSIFQPSAQHLIEARYVQVADEDDSGDPPGPGGDDPGAEQIMPEAQPEDEPWPP